MIDDRPVTPAQEKMLAGYLRHTASEFETQSVDTALATMVEHPHVYLLPVLIGGEGREEVRRFYAERFIFSMPPDVEFVPISRTVGGSTIVEESLLRFTHDQEVEWILPGVAPTGRRVEVAVCTVVRMQGEKVAHEHVYWDQASVLAQVGLLDGTGLPVVGAEAARKLEGGGGALNRLVPEDHSRSRTGEAR
jgi:carboxymethylenebutenolidase